MIKALLAVILLFILMPAHCVFAQETPGGSKTFSGYFHQSILKNKGSFWHSLFGGKASTEGEVVEEKQCFAEFKSPVPFSRLAVAVLPEALTYSIRFKDSRSSSQGDLAKEKDAFEKSIIKIYTNDDQEYSIVPNSERKIFDSYLIYLIMSSDIDHLEIVSTSAQEKEGQDRCVLDKVEIHNNH